MKPKTQEVRLKKIRAKMQKNGIIYFYPKFRKKKTKITYNGNISPKIQREKKHRTLTSLLLTKENNNT